MLYVLGGAIGYVVRSFLRSPFLSVGGGAGGGVGSDEGEGVNGVKRKRKRNQVHHKQNANTQSMFLSTLPRANGSGVDGD